MLVSTLPPLGMCVASRRACVALKEGEWVPHTRTLSVDPHSRFIYLVRAQDVEIPFLDWEIDPRTNEATPMHNGKKDEQWHALTAIMLKNTPFTTLPALSAFRESLRESGTTVVVFQLWDSPTGPELKAVGDDIVWYRPDEEVAEKEKEDVGLQEQNAYLTSLRAYLGILYRRWASATGGCESGLRSRCPSHRHRRCCTCT